MAMENKITPEMAVAALGKVVAAVPPTDPAKNEDMSDEEAWAMEQDDKFGEDSETSYTDDTIDDSSDIMTSDSEYEDGEKIYLKIKMESIKIVKVFSYIVIAFFLTIGSAIILYTQFGLAAGIDPLTIMAHPDHEVSTEETYIPMVEVNFEAMRVVLMHTETASCYTFDDCVILLTDEEYQEVFEEYNFLLSSDGYIYAILGWQTTSALYQETPTMVVGFIGTYVTTAPTAVQIDQLHVLLETSEKLNYLHNSYTICGRKRSIVPVELFLYMAKLSRWNWTDSDVDEQGIINMMKSIQISRR